MQTITPFLWFEDQAEEAACGWLSDPYGVAWQVTPVVLNELRKDPDPEKSRRAMKAMMQMVKIDIQQIKQAVAGQVEAKK